MLALKPGKGRGLRPFSSGSVVSVSLWFGRPRSDEGVRNNCFAPFTPLAL